MRPLDLPKLKYCISRPKYLNADSHLILHLSKYHPAPNNRIFMNCWSSCDKILNLKFSLIFSERGRINMHSTHKFIQNIRETLSLWAIFIWKQRQWNRPRHIFKIIYQILAAKLRWKHHFPRSQSRFFRVHCSPALLNLLCRIVRWFGDSLETMYSDRVQGTGWSDPIKISGIVKRIFCSELFGAFDLSKSFSFGWLCRSLVKEEGTRSNALL